MGKLIISPCRELNSPRPSFPPKDDSVRAVHAVDGPGRAWGRCGPIRTLASRAPYRQSFRWERHQARSNRQSPEAPKARNVSHFLAVLLLLLIINLAPSSALGKVERFIDSQGVIHINSGGQEKGGQAKAPSGSGKHTLGALSGPAGIMGSHPAGEPPAEPAPGSENNEPPPDLGALGQPWSLPQVAQSISGGKTAMRQGTTHEAVSYTPDGDPF